MSYKIKLDQFFSYSFSLAAVILGYKEGEIQVLLIKRAMDPFKGSWAVPGDLIYPKEDLAVAASRILYDLTKLENIQLLQAQTFGAPFRHPQGRVITCVYLALVNIDHLNAVPSSWAIELKWQPLRKLPPLAFDHNMILKSTFDVLRQKLKSLPVCFDLLPLKFTLNDLQGLYEYAFDRVLDKANFRKKIKTLPLIKHNEKQKNVRHRPAAMYSFDRLKYQEMVKEGGYTFKM